MIDEIIDKYPNKTFLKVDGFDDAILGVDKNDFTLVYSVDRCINILVNEGMEEEDAIEHFYYNVIGSYMGEKTPTFIEEI